MFSQRQELLSNASNMVSNALIAYQNEGSNKKRHLGSLITRNARVGTWKLTLDFNSFEVMDAYQASITSLIYHVQNFGNRFVPMDYLHKMCLCGNDTLLSKLAKVDEIDLTGDKHGWLYEKKCFHYILDSDWVTLRKYAQLMEKDVTKYHDLFFPEIHFKIFEAFYTQNLPLMEESLLSLNNEGIIKIKQKAFAEAKYVHIELIAYSILARKNGINVWSSRSEEHENLLNNFPSNWEAYAQVRDYHSPNLYDFVEF